MKRLLWIILIGCAGSARAQSDKELVVYSIRGNVSVIEDSRETKARIGKLLKPGSSIKTEKLSRLTMVCPEGKPLSVSREGVYPVVTWKDSCNTDHLSLTSQYFRYVWDQMYVRSDEYKKKHPEAVGAVARDDAPVRGDVDRELEIPPGLDTLHYAGTEFRLAWHNTWDYTGNYFFRLVHAQTGKTVFADSVSLPVINSSVIQKYLRSGNSYKWSVTAPPDILGEGGIIKCLPPKKSGEHIRKMKKLIAVPEDAAMENFRTAYFLESEHWLGEAWQFYQKAVKAAPGETFYQEQLTDFEKRYLLK